MIGSFVVEINHRSFGSLHDRHIRNICQSRRPAEIAACHRQAVNHSSPAAIRDLRPVQQVDIAESLSIRTHGSQKAVVYVFLNTFSGGRVAGKPQILRAELHPGNPDASLHHPFDVRIGLLYSGIAPALAHQFGPVNIRAGVADDSDLLIPHSGEEVCKAIQPSRIPRSPVILSESLEYRGHLISLRIWLSDFIQRGPCGNERKDVAPFIASGPDNIAGEVEILFLTGDKIKPHEWLQDRRGLDVRGTPAELRDRLFRGRTYLVHHRTRLFFHRLQHNRILLDIKVILAQAKEDVFTLPNITVTISRLLVHRSATDRAVFFRGSYQGIHVILCQLPELGITGITP